MVDLPDWIPAEAWAGYVDMRARSPKTKMTPRAMELRIKDLEKFRDAGHDIGAILDNSTVNGYTDLYEPKDRRQGNEAGRRAIPQLGKAGNVTAAAAQEWLDDGPMDDTLDARRRFASLLTNLSDYYRSEMSKAMLGIYWAGLRQFSYEAIEKACWAHTQLPDEAGRWMPRNSDIIKMIDGGTDDRAQQAWSMVDSAVRTRGTWDDVVFDDPIIHRVISDMGGWIQVGSKEDKEWPFVAKEFQQRYRSFRQRNEIPEHPTRLIGIANAQNKAGGRPLLPPILIGNHEMARQVVKGLTTPGSLKALE